MCPNSQNTYDNSQNEKLTLEGEKETFFSQGDGENLSEIIKIPNRLYLVQNQIESQEPTSTVLASIELSKKTKSKSKKTSSKKSKKKKIEAEQNNEGSVEDQLNLIHNQINEIKEKQLRLMYLLNEIDSQIIPN